MACPVQDWSHINWQWQTHRETHKLHNSWNCCMKSGACLLGSMSEQHPQHCWWGGNWLWDMPTGSDERIGHAPCRSFNMTMPCLTLPFSLGSFWQNKKWLPSPTHCTPLIWHPVTSFRFQKWNCSWKDAGLIPLRRSRPNRREYLTLWQKWRWWDRCLHVGGNYFEGDGNW
jgi:hypothetical protein